jgi:MazG family protein
MEEVAASISDKLERRHPHVFGDTSVENADEVLRNWEAIKSREHEEKGREPSVLEGLSRHLPALLRARRAQERAAKVGFRWDRSDDVVEKAREEVEEFLVAREDGNAERLEEELGDLLFSLVNVASYLRICPEEALRKTIGKFEARFRFIESELAKAGKTPQAATIEEMDRLWECSKSA